MHVQIRVRHHCAALIPLPPANNVDMPHPKGIGTTDDRPHIKVAHHIINRNMKCRAMFIKIGNDRLVWQPFVVVYYIAVVGCRRGRLLGALHGAYW